MREKAAKLVDPVRTIASGTPLTLVVATPPTFASVGKSDTLICAEATVPGEVKVSPAQAASAIAARAAAAVVTKSRRGIESDPPPIPRHGQLCPHGASGIRSLLLIECSTPTASERNGVDANSV
jgi:hypothetical protein